MDIKKDLQQTEVGPALKVSNADKGNSASKAVADKGGKLSRSYWLLTAVISLVVSVSSVFVYDRFIVQKVVTIDIKGYIAEQRDLYMAGKINDEQFRANLDRLEKTVEAIPKNRVAVMGDAVVKNAEMIKP